MIKLLNKERITVGSKLICIEERIDYPMNVGDTFLVQNWYSFYGTTKISLTGINKKINYQIPNHDTKSLKFY